MRIAFRCPHHLDMPATSKEMEFSAFEMTSPRCARLHSHLLATATEAIVELLEHQASTLEPYLPLARRTHFHFFRLERLARPFVEPV